MRNNMSKICCYILIMSTLIAISYSDENVSENISREQIVQQPDTDFSTSDGNGIQTQQPGGLRPISPGIFKPRQPLPPFVPKPVVDRDGNVITGGSTDGSRGISTGSTIGKGGVIRGAVISRHNVEFFDAPIQRQQFTPQVIEFDAGQLPLTLRFRSASSRINVQQVHTGGDGGEERTQSEDKPYLIFHESTRPVIQEVREVITPYRRVIQQIQPVQEEIHTYVARGRDDGTGSFDGGIDGSDGVVRGVGGDIGGVGVSGGSDNRGDEGSTGIIDGFGVRKPGIGDRRTSTDFDGRVTGDGRVTSGTDIRVTGQRGTTGGRVTGDRGSTGTKTVVDSRIKGDGSERVGTGRRVGGDYGTKSANLRDARDSEVITTEESNRRFSFERAVEEDDRNYGIRSSFGGDFALLLDMDQINEMRQYFN